MPQPWRNSPATTPTGQVRDECCRDVGWSGRPIVSTEILRCLLAPRTSWRALRLIRTGDESLDFDTAWRRIRLRLCPDEVGSRDYGHGQPSADVHPGHWHSERGA